MYSAGCHGPMQRLRNWKQQCFRKNYRGAQKRHYRPPVGDVVHFTRLSTSAKALRLFFFNWWLKCKDERINLGLLRTLKNRSDKATMDSFRNLIPKNDHVKNKD